MRVTVRLFAAARERAGAGALEVELPGAPTVEALLCEVARVKPALASLVPQLRVAVGHDFAHGDALIPEGADVALIPPVAGG